MRISPRSSIGEKVSGVLARLASGMVATPSGVREKCFPAWRAGRLLPRLASGTRAVWWAGGVRPRLEGGLRGTPPGERVDGDCD